MVLILFMAGCQKNGDIQNPTWQQVGAAFKDVAWEFPHEGSPLFLNSFEGLKDNEKILLVRLSDSQLIVWLESAGLSVKDLQIHKVEERDLMTNRPPWFQLKIGEEIRIVKNIQQIPSKINKEKYPWLPLQWWVRNNLENNYEMGVLLHQNYD